MASRELKKSCHRCGASSTTGRKNKIEGIEGSKYCSSNCTTIFCRNCVKRFEVIYPHAFINGCPLVKVILASITSYCCK